MHFGRVYQYQAFVAFQEMYLLSNGEDRLDLTINFRPGLFPRRYYRIHVLRHTNRLPRAVVRGDCYGG